MTIMHPPFGRPWPILFTLLAVLAGSAAAEDPTSVAGYSLVVQAPIETSVVGREPAG